MGRGRRPGAPFCDSPNQYRLPFEDVRTSLPQMDDDIWGRKNDVFFVVQPEPDKAARTAAVAAELKRRFELQGKLRPTHIFHISLLNIGAYGDLPPGVIQVIRSSVSAIETMAPFEVAFDRVMSFRGKSSSPLVMRCCRGVGELASLRNALGTVLVDAGATRGRRASFTPHATLLYDSAMVPETALDEPLHWNVRKVALVRSLVGKSRYQPLAGWMLGG